MAAAFIEALKSSKPDPRPLNDLDKYLTLRTYVNGYSQTDEDIELWKLVRQNKVAVGLIKQGSKIVPNLARWFNFIDETAKPSLDLPTRPKDDGTNYDIGLPDTEKGVVTRFPPEPSGYLHVGHMKAALLNDYFGHKKYNGRMLLRFDDTNPTKEKQEYEDSIIKDLELMAIKPDAVSYTSDYFQLLHDKCKEFIRMGHAYADNTPLEVLRTERMERIESKNRNMSIEESLAHFAEMETGSEEGAKWYIRAKIDMSSNNGRMRDPVIYRCNPEAHHRTGTTWKMYPLYDWACPIVDSVEGVTHALRTTEYNDADEQYQWILEKLGMRKVHNWNFARMDFKKTFLSKRKLTKVVDSGKVWGWDDPRMPTVRGVRRRGMTVPALQEYIIKQGPSKNITLQTWDAFWNTNKKYIDPTAKRYTAVETANKVVCNVVGAPEAPRTEEKDVHAKNAELGKKKVVFSKRIILDQADAQSFEDNEEITLMNWGNAIVRKKTYSLNPLQLLKSADEKTITGLELELHLQGDVRKTAKKVTWLSEDQELIPLTMYEFDYLINKDKLEEEDTLEDCLNPITEVKTEALADCNVAGLKVDDIVQFDRKGFFRIDKAFQHGQSVVAFQIPTGKNQNANHRVTCHPRAHAHVIYTLSLTYSAHVVQSRRTPPTFRNQRSKLSLATTPINATLHAKPTTHNHRQQCPPSSTSPPNLRATILTLALTTPTPLALPGIYPDYHGRAATTTALTRTHLAPAQINQQLRLEALPLFYRTNTFAICLQPVCVKFLGRRKGKLREIFRRSYGDEVTALWFASLPEEVLGQIRELRVYVACVTRWDPEGDEAAMEREKLKAYEVGEVKTRKMTEHVLYDMCSGRRLFYEVGVEGFVETFGYDGEGMQVDVEGEVWGGEECGVCKAVLRRWVDSVDEDEGGKKVVTREKLVELVWPSGLEPAPERGRGDARI